MVPRRRPLIRQKRRQCSRMGSTSQGERGVVSGTGATVEGPPPRNGDLTAELHSGRCCAGLSSRIGRTKNFRMESQLIAG